MTAVYKNFLPDAHFQVVSDLFNNVSHDGTVQTDTDTRVVINFNLRTRE